MQVIKHILLQEEGGTQIERAVETWAVPEQSVRLPLGRASGWRTLHFLGGVMCVLTWFMAHDALRLMLVSAILCIPYLSMALRRSWRRYISGSTALAATSLDVALISLWLFTSEPSPGLPTVLSLLHSDLEVSPLLQSCLGAMFRISYALGSLFAASRLLWRVLDNQKTMFTQFCEFFCSLALHLSAPERMLILGVSGNPSIRMMYTEDVAEEARNVQRLKTARGTLHTVSELWDQLNSSIERCQRREATMQTFLTDLKNLCSDKRQRQYQAKSAAELQRLSAFNTRCTLDLETFARRLNAGETALDILSRCVQSLVEDPNKLAVKICDLITDAEGLAADIAKSSADCADLVTSSKAFYISVVTEWGYMTESNIDGPTAVILRTPSMIPGNVDGVSPIAATSKVDKTDDVVSENHRSDAEDKRFIGNENNEPVDDVSEDSNSRETFTFYHSYVSVQPSVNCVGDKGLNVSDGAEPYPEIVGVVPLRTPALMILEEDRADRSLSNGV